MIGNTEGGPGVMVQTMNELFSSMEDAKHEKLFKFRISYLEVYNETIRDLLVANSKLLNLRVGL